MQITATKIEGLRNELNLFLKAIKDRLAALEGDTGEISVNNRMVSKNDIVLTSHLSGIIMRDENNPPRYWKTVVKNDGTLLTYELGGSYVDESGGSPRAE